MQASAVPSQIMLWDVNSLLTINSLLTASKKKKTSMKEIELMTFELAGQKEQYIIWVSSVAKKNLQLGIEHNCSFDFHVGSYIISMRINKICSFPPKFTDGRN